MNTVLKIVIAGSVWLIWTLIAEKSKLSGWKYWAGFSVASLVTIALFSD
ncbi:hypothetical protein N9C75_05330 [Alphaproteobacteria bacterium]|jgi:hypothetical protein|nr:hypothetical protein [Alphaproteobacteria bacterium]MDA9190591.1 hypothetical protein [Alphaproteobacteria bacterium]MDA9816455.1 hypothetical protein [Alphaproteobacteria bacterium]MDC3311988.1 hypothetical protein [Alphaproteobacteria bacterium]